MRLAVCTVTMKRDGYDDCVDSWKALDFIPHDNSFENIGVVGGMQRIYERTKNYDVLAYFHDDLIIREPWQERVLAEFEDPKVGVVGFGGSLVHGAHDIYKVPYHISQMGRGFYMSNTDDAEVHGERFLAQRTVATIDGFCLVVRRSLLDRLRGWPVKNLSFHGYDHFITLGAHLLGYAVRLVGISCHHLGGQTSVKMKADDGSHEKAHRWLYDEFRDVLPVEVPR